MRRKLFVLTLLTLLLMPGLHALAQGGPSTVTIALTDDPPSGDPHKTRGANGGHLLFNLFDGLVALSGDMTAITPALATSWERLDDTTWKFVLRQGFTLHNGEPFTATAVNDCFY